MAAGEKTLLHMGDTDIFSDMALINEIYRPKIGIVPIGDRFTMGAKLAAMACKRFYNFETAIPCHYGTFGLLDPTADKFIAEMEGAKTARARAGARACGDALGRRRLLPVLLDAGRAQAGEAVLVDRLLPGQELLDGQRVAGAGLLEAEQAAAHGGDDFRLAADDPALGIARRKIRNRQRAAIGPDDVFHARTHLFGHSTLVLNLTN